MRELGSLTDVSCRNRHVSSVKMMTLHCQEGDHSWEIPSRRGRPPLVCPECKAKAVKPKPVKAKVERPIPASKPAVMNIPIVAPDAPHPSAVWLVKAREKKAEMARERALRASEERIERRARIVEQLPSIHAMWNRSFTVAMRENTDEAWRRCESLMTGYVSAKRSLQK